MKASKHDHERHVRACPQIKEANKQTDVTLKREARALVHKLRKQANMTTKGHVMTCPQTEEARKQLGVTSKRDAKLLVHKLWKQASKLT